MFLRMTHLLHAEVAVDAAGQGAVAHLGDDACELVEAGTDTTPRKRTRSTAHEEGCSTSTAPGAVVPMSDGQKCGATRACVALSPPSGRVMRRFDV